MRPYLWAICVCALAVAALPLGAFAAAPPRPNIVHIFADDLGWGSVGFNGQTQILTPNLDALAAGGMRLNDAYSCPVCAASRATLYTGFHTGHSSVDGNDELTEGFRSIDVMTPQVLAPAGYTSAVYGKWGFGADGVRSLTGSDPTPSINAPNSLPANFGFSTFYGYLNHGAAQDYFYDWMWKNQTGAPNGVVTVANNGGPGGTPQYTHDLFAAQSEQYIASHAGGATPFYMQVDYTIPHYDVDGVASAPNGLDVYASKPWTAHQKAYAAMITRMDASIGSLIQRLKDPNHDGFETDSILNNTLVIFTSDNGPSNTEDLVAGETPAPDFFDANGQYRGGKFELYEGGIHMPAVAYWPGKIAAGSQTNYRTDLSDFMATAADLAGVETPVGIDGTSIAPVLTGQGRMRQRKYLVFEHQGSDGGDPDPRIARWTVIRQDGKKLMRYDNETTELYDLATDPDENAPLNLASNAALVTELEGYAIAEGITGGVVQYRTWSGPNGGNVQDDANWSGVGAPDSYWSASMVNAGGSPAISHVSADVNTLGVEIRGTTQLQAVNIHAGRTLTGRNEVRIGNHGRVDLVGGTAKLATNRWVNVRAGGQIAGEGTVAGDVYNEGTVSPGQASGDPAWPIAAPAALPPTTLNSGIVTAAAFNFTGVQDDVPVVQTSLQSPYVEVSHGLDFGPGVGPRWGSGGTNAGNEFNIIGHNTTSLAQAITNGDYITFTVDAVAGTGAIPDSVSFQLWRNGSASAKNFAILSSVGGFTSGAALVQANYSDTGSGAQHVLSTNIPAVTDALSGPIEYRLYAWNATAATGNFHVNAASLNARFVAVPTLEFNFSGVQDGPLLTALKRSDTNLNLTAGLSFGSGVLPRNANNVGNEFHVAGFSTSPTLQSAILGSDYLTFTVQAIPGMALIPDSASFTLWRQGAGSATDYALMSSIGGFGEGLEVVQMHVTSTGSGNNVTIGGSFANAVATTAPVEYRLYGWNASTVLDSTHVVGASMRARFASVVGSQVDPTGKIRVEGDYYHLAGSTLAIDLGGPTAGTEYDLVQVLGKAELEGDLSVALADVNGSPFAPGMNATFDILTATLGVTGQFAHLTLPTLSPEFEWRVSYLPTMVRLTVFSSADFNHDGVIDAGDYAVWRDGFGTLYDQDDYDHWRAHYGLSIVSGSGAVSSLQPAVPEPAALILLLAGMLAVVLPRRVRTS